MPELELATLTAEPDGKRILHCDVDDTTEVGDEANRQLCKYQLFYLQRLLNSRSSNSL